MPADSYIVITIFIRLNGLMETSHGLIMEKDTARAIFLPLKMLMDTRRGLRMEKGIVKVVFLLLNSKFWYINGKLHREDGPAVEYTNGQTEWYSNGLLHREGGGPANEKLHGYRGKMWYKNGQLHRDFGFPAIEWGNGTNEWYIKGQRVLNGKKRYEANRI